MYFITGGRGTQSGLYRVEYIGPKIAAHTPTAQQIARRQFSKDSRATRRRLESLLGRPSSDGVAKAWPHLDDADPWIRHVARAVLEWQPVAEWKARVGEESTVAARVAAVTALSRVGSVEDVARTLDRLAIPDWSRLSDSQKLEVVFLCDRFLDADSENKTRKTAVSALMDSHYPDASPVVNQRLGTLLSRTAPPKFVARTMRLLSLANSDADRLHWLFLLRDQTDGWTDVLRTSYMQQLRRMSEFVAAEGMPNFQRLIRDEAIKSVPKPQRAKFSEMLNSNPVESWRAEISKTPRKLVRKWQVADLTGDVDDLAGRDLKRGRQVFVDAKCIVCHRVAGRGGVSGPDLDAVGQRFTSRDSLVSIIEPSKVVSEKYRNSSFILKNGKSVVGRLLPGDYRSDEIRVIPNLLEPTQISEFKKAEVEAHHSSDVSPMPKGLLDAFDREEILDLLAYLKSGRQAGGSNPAASRR